MIDKEKEYSFKYCKNYGRAIDEILLILQEEYPLAVKKIEDANLGFAVTALIIHALNYSYQIKPIMAAKGEVKGNG